MKQLTKEKFIEKYKSKNIKDLAKELEVSRTTIQNYAKKFNLYRKRQTLIIE